jgi:hypothetical protein
MSDIIYVDEQGKEIDRKAKGRGRPPKGDVQPNGDIIITLIKESASIPLPKKQTPKIEEKSLEANPAEAVEADNVMVETVTPIRKKKAIRVSPSITLDALIQAFMPLEKIQNDGMIILNGVIVNQKLGSEFEILIPYQSVYSRVIIDIKNNNIKFWVTPTMSPKARIERMKQTVATLSDIDEEKEIEKGYDYSEPADIEIEGCLKQTQE